MEGGWGVGLALGFMAAGRNPAPPPRLDSRPGQDDAADFLPGQGGDRHGHGQIRVVVDKAVRAEGMRAWNGQIVDTRDPILDMFDFGPEESTLLMFFKRREGARGGRFLTQQIKNLTEFRVAGSPPAGLVILQTFMHMAREAASGRSLTNQSAEERHHVSVGISRPLLEQGLFSR